MRVETTDEWSHNNPCLEDVIKVTNLIFIHEWSIELKLIIADLLSGKKEEDLGFQTKIHLLGVGADTLLIEPR